MNIRITETRVYLATLEDPSNTIHYRQGGYKLLSKKYHEQKSITSDITQHEGCKYLRRIDSAIVSGESVSVDVYAVLEAFAVTCPARQHAIKKLLCAGLRSKGDAMADLQGALAAVNRAIELERNRNGNS